MPLLKLPRGRASRGPTFPALLAAALLLASLGGASPADDEPTSDTQPRAFEARTTLQLKHGLLRDFGVELLGVSTTADPHRPGGLGFSSRVTAPLRHSAAAGDVERLEAGVLAHAGGFSLALGAERLSLQGFQLRVTAPPHEFELVDAAGERWFWLANAHVALSPDGRELRLRHLDLSLSKGFAERLGRPELAGHYAGVVDLDLPLEAERGIVVQGACCVGNFDPELDVDVELTDLSPPEQTAREAGVRVALSASATLRNSGQADVEWYHAIAGLDHLPPEVGPHPYLSLHLYRLRSGELKQIGQSGVKHAFYAQNSGCPCCGGHILFAGCSDLYSAGTNDDPTYLGPRDEVSASTGAWESLGSHFDGALVDDFRDHNAVDHDVFEHRLVVAEADLTTPDAQFFFEAWYLAARDVDLFNSLGRRQIVPELRGSTWIFSAVDVGLAQGSILDVLVPPGAASPGATSSLLDTGQGRLQLAVTTSQGGDGRYRYEYALMNFDYDRQISRFSVPLEPGAEAAEAGFSASVDGAPWIATLGETDVTWQAPPGESLDWGSLASFRIEAGLAPGAGQAELLALEPGGGPALAIDTLVPVPEPARGLLLAAALAGLRLLSRSKS